jgi:GMP synthase (glutamine-hydrolysing)
VTDDVSEDGRDTVKRLLVVQHQVDGGLGRLGPLLEAARPGLDVDLRRPDLGDPLPADLAGLDGLVVLGGSMAAWEDERAPWLPHTRALLARAVDESVPVFSICLGAQLLALATGGRVERGAAGIEAGLSDIRPTADAAGDPLMAALPEGGFRAAQGHHDAIIELPPRAVLLATGELYRHQAYRVGDVAWAVQYHPEVTADDFDAWMREDAEVLAVTGRDPAEIARQVRAADAELDALAAAHARGFLGVVTGAATGASTVVVTGAATGALPAAG